MATLGWIGFGRIGTPMALRVVAAGHRVQGYDILEDNLAAALAQGAVRAHAAADAAAGAEVVFLCLPDTDAVESAVFGPAGVAAGAPRGAIIVDHSSILPDRSRAMAQRAQADHGIGWIDAPVSGGPGAASAGTLTAWLGGDTALVARASPWIATYASRISHMGASGLGQVAKSCNQAVVCVTVAAWAEMLRYARHAGLDAPFLVETLEGSGSDSLIRHAFGRGLAEGRFPELSRRNMTKDLKIIADLAGATATPMALTQAALALFADDFPPT